MATEGTNDATTVASRCVPSWTALVGVAVALLTWSLAITLTTIGLLGLWPTSEFQRSVPADTPTTISAPTDEPTEVEAWSRDGRSGIAVNVEPTSDQVLPGQFVDVFVTTQVDGKSESKLLIPHVLVLAMGAESPTIKSLALTSEEVTKLENAIKEGPITLRAPDRFRLVAVEIEPTSDHVAPGQYVDVFVTTQVDGKSDSKLVIPHVLVCSTGGDLGGDSPNWKALALKSNDITKLTNATKEGSITLRLSDNKK